MPCEHDWRTEVGRDAVVQGGKKNCENFKWSMVDRGATFPVAAANVPQYF